MEQLPSVGREEIMNSPDLVSALLERGFDLKGDEKIKNIAEAIYRAFLSEPSTDDRILDSLLPANGNSDDSGFYRNQAKQMFEVIESFFKLPNPPSPQSAAMEVPKEPEEDVGGDWLKAA